MWRVLSLVVMLGGAIASAGAAVRDYDPVRVDLVCRAGQRVVREAVDGRWRALSPGVVQCTDDGEGDCVFTWRTCEPDDPSCPASFVTVARRSEIVFGDARAVVRFRCVDTAS